MRKIEIDDTIRGYTQDYASKVLAKSQNVAQDLKKLGDFVAANNTWKDKDVVTDYIDLLINDYPVVLTLEPRKWASYMQKYDMVLQREPDMLTKKVVYGVSGNGKVYEAPFYERIIFCLRYEDARLILGEIQQQMGLKTCVYCNMILTISNDEQVFYQMDHYLPQSKYPFLGTCFYNLQPSCGICNGHKGTKDSDFGLYVNVEQHKVLSPFRFVPKVSCGMGPYPICSGILFKGRGKRVTKESKAHEKLFHIDTMYAGCTNEVSKLYENAYKTNDSLVQAMAASFGFVNTKANAIAYLSNQLSLDEADIHKEPLTKLRQDTIKQMKEGGVI